MHTNKHKPEHRPPITAWKAPETLDGYPPYPHAPSGVLIEGHANWRLEKPVAEIEKCKNCGLCELLCPDAAIYFTADRQISIDYELCKGCGICAFECKFGAITMEKEGNSPAAKTETRASEEKADGCASPNKNELAPAGKAKENGDIS